MRVFEHNLNAEQSSLYSELAEVGHDLADAAIRKQAGGSGHHDMQMTIIGGSLAGLTFALACARRGIRTQVLEQSVGSPQNGGALGIDRALLMRVAGATLQGEEMDGHSFPPLTARRNAATWQAVHAWLRAQVLRCPQATLLEGTTVREVTQDATAATVTTDSGQRLHADGIVGADGSRSLVRRALNPERPRGRYAGYLLWRGLIPEVDLGGVPPAGKDDGVALLSADGCKLVAYPVAGPDGSLRAGDRLISFTWYDAGQASLLRDLQCLDDDGTVLGSPDPADVPPAVLGELHGRAGTLWPDPWRSAIQHALTHWGVFATPVEEYSPVRLHWGRLAIIGDAAHAVSPVTGQGFVAGILDAEALAECLGQAAVHPGQTVPEALAAYQQRRLPGAQALVAVSERWSRAFVANQFAAVPVRH